MAKAVNVPNRRSSAESTTRPRTSSRVTITHPHLQNSLRDSATATKSSADDEKGGTQSASNKGKEKEQPHRTTLRVELFLRQSVSSLHIQDPEQYVKVTTFTPNGRALAVASTDGQVALHRYPALSPIWNDAGEPSSSTLAAAEASDTSFSIPSQDFENSEIYDADFSHSNTHVVFTSSSKLVVYATEPFSESSADDAAIEGTGNGDAAHQSAEGFAQTIQTIKNPALGGKGPCSFRAARFGRGEASKEKLFHCCQCCNPQAAKAQSQDPQELVTAWDADSWDLIETRHVSDRPVTVFDVHPTASSSHTDLPISPSVCSTPRLCALFSRSYTHTISHQHVSSSTLLPIC